MFAIVRASLFFALCYKVLRVTRFSSKKQVLWLLKTTGPPYCISQCISGQVETRPLAAMTNFAFVFANNLVYYVNSFFFVREKQNVDIMTNALFSS